MSASKNLLTIITGASQSFGRAVAIETARQCTEQNLLFVLTARNALGLTETERLIKIEAPNAKVITVPFDMSNVSQIDEMIFNALDDEVLSSLDTAVLVNSAGTLGDCSQKVENHSTDTSALSAYVNLNITSSICVTSAFVRKFKYLMSKCFVVNVTSLFAIQPTGHFGLYGMSRAAKEMYHNVLAAEEGEDSTVRVLTWSPGVMKTDVYKDIMDNCGNGGIIDALKGMDKQGACIDPIESAEKMVEIVLKGTFKQGSRVDFYDVRHANQQ
eukprot:CFRG1594T1